jgi:hypothetical protein
LEIKFQLSENIEWHSMQLELDWIQIQFKKSGMQIGAKGIEDLFVNMVYEG